MVKYHHGNQCSGLSLRDFILSYLHKRSVKKISHQISLFGNDTYTFSAVKNINVSTDQVNSDLEKTFNWDH